MPLLLVLAEYNFFLLKKKNAEQIKSTMKTRTMRGIFGNPVITCAEICDGILNFMHATCCWLVEVSIVIEMKGDFGNMLEFVYTECCHDII